MKRPTLLLLLALAAGLFLWSSAFQVSESETVIVSRLGDPSRVVDEPGLHFKWPAPIDSLVRVDERMRVLDPDAAEFLTADKQNILANYFVAWTVADPRRFVETTRGDRAIAEARLRDSVTAKVGTLLGSHLLTDLVAVPGDEALAAPQTTMAEVNARLTELAGEDTAADYGIEVVLARIKRLGFPAQNQTAVFRRMEAERTRFAKEVRAKGLENAEKIRSDAKLEIADIQSEAQQEAARIQSGADAEAARILGEAHAQAPELQAFLQGLEAARQTFAEGDLFVMPSDHFLVRLLNGEDVAPPSPEPPPQ